MLVFCQHFLLQQNDTDEQKAIPNPRQKQENEYRIKFCFNTEYAANSANNEVVIDESIKPFFLPVILIL